MQICSSEKCYGCGACAAQCPQKCITMQLNQFGFDMPVIDEKSCVNCNSCVNVCPAVNPPVQREPQKVYAAWNSCSEAHRTSTSGGISDALVKSVIEQGGVAFGAVLNDDLTVSHKSAKTAEEANCFKKSKYVQSRTLDTFREVKAALKDGKKVLYTGTPCQTAGLKRFIGENENLFLVDIICHGTPSMSILKEHIGFIEKKAGKKADFVSFREKGMKLSLFEKDELFYSGKSTEDVWYIGFLKGLFYKEACYTCPFASSARASDITIGDFWGLKDNELASQAKYGVSVVLCNTGKGKSLLEQAEDKLVLYERSLSEAKAGNAQLRHPMPKHKKHGYFCENYVTKGFEKTASKALLLNRIKYFVAKCLGRA